MKKLVLVALLATAFHVLNAQPAISVSGGVKLIGTEERTTTLWYVDESPSRDNIYKDIGQIGKVAINLNVRWTDDTPDKIFRPFIEGQGYLGAINGLSLNGGYVFSGTDEGKKVRVQPELGAVIGYCSKGIGAIENNDVYIQVNQTRFQNYTDVFVSLRNAYIGIKPGLSFIFKSGINSEIGLGVNYQLSYKVGFINFRGTDNNENIVSEIEYLTAKNVGFYVDGDRTDKNPYNPDGLEFKLFYSF
jgi:hypothetical protein